MTASLPPRRPADADPRRIAAELIAPEADAWTVGAWAVRWLEMQELVETSPDRLRRCRDFVERAVRAHGGDPLPSLTLGEWAVLHEAGRRVGSEVEVFAVLLAMPRDRPFIEGFRMVARAVGG